MLRLISALSLTLISAFLLMGFTFLWRKQLYGMETCLFNNHISRVFKRWNKDEGKALINSIIRRTLDRSINKKIVSL